MYNVKDNAETKLSFWISSIATTLIVEEWTWSVFPLPPFIAVLNKRDDEWRILKSEKIEVTAIDWDQFSITRWFDWSERFDFNAWDCLSLFVMAKHIQELQDAVNWILHDISEDWLVKAATTTSSWTVKIASNENVNNVENTDWKWVFLVPKVSDLVPEYIGSLFISASDIAIWADTYVHEEPNYLECVAEYYIWKEENNKILDLQWLSNWRSFSQVTLKLNKWWLPTTKLIVEVMSASKNGNYWIGENVLACWELEADSINWLWSYTIQLDKTISLVIWSPFVVRLRQTDNIVNAMNYFICYGHPNKNSDIFSWNYIVWSTIINTWNDIYFSCLWKLNQALRQKTNWVIVHEDTYIKRSAEVVASGFSYPFNISSPDIDWTQPITLSWTIQFVQHANNWATLYSDNPAQWWMSYLWVDSNKVRDISANWRTYTISLNKKSVSLNDLATWVIKIIGQSSLSTRDHRWSECYFSISWNLTLNFTDINSWWEVQQVYIRNNAKRLWLVSATLVWKHIDWQFIYPKNDWSHAVIAGQKWDDGKKLQLKVENKCFYYKYDWDNNWIKLSDFYDFIGPVGPRWVQWERGPAWWINFRWKLSSISDLPEMWSIEWEAYAINWSLYIRDWSYFRNSWIASSSINVLTDWNNIENKPDFVRLSDEVAYQISQWNYEYVWRLTERCYTQINLLVKDLWLTSWEDIIEIANTWYGKLISHDYLYNTYINPSTYAKTYFNRNDTNYLFNFTERLDTQIWYIDSSLWIESVDDIEDLMNKYIWKILANDNFYNNYIAKSTVALNYINRNNTDTLFELEDLFYQNLNYIDASYCFTAWDTFLEMLELPEEMTKFWSHSVLRNSYFLKSEYAKTEYNNLSEVKAIKIFLWIFWENITKYSSYTDFFADSELMDKLISNWNCLYAICNKVDAYSAMCSSSVAMNKIISSQTSLNILGEHSDVMEEIWSNSISREIFISSSSAMSFVKWNTIASTTLAASSATLTTISQNLSYIRNLFSDSSSIKQNLYTAFQPYSYKMYTTLNTNITWTKYYTSDRDRSECWTKIEYRNTYYTFWDNYLIFPAYYWDDWDSRSQQLRSEKFWLNVWYPHSSYANQQNIDIIAMSSDSKPMGFALKGCSAVSLWWSNNGVWIIVFNLSW